jgi:PAS domain S-box-containing protein
MDKDHIKILLIEDDEDDYALVRELLSEIKFADFSLEWVKTYQEGFKELRRADHDAYLLDYGLGSRNGLELIREAREAGCDKPIIFLTGQGGYGVDMGAMRCGAADYLVKDQLTADMLERSIRHSIARKDAERELKSYRYRLEDLVRERTEQLETANENLRVKIAERTLAEEALRVSEVRYRRLHESLMDAFASVDMEGRIKECNEVFRKMLGYAPEEIVLLTYKDITPEKWHSFEAEIIERQVLSMGYSGIYEKEYRRKDGNVFPVELRAYLLTDDLGVPFGIGSIIRDITERKKAEEALQQSEREKAILNEIANVFLTTPDEKIYEEVLAVILKALKCRYGIFGYIGDSGDLIIPSMTKEIWSDCQVEGKSIVFPRHLWGDSLWGRSIKEMKTFCSEGPFQTPEGHLPIHNFLTVPIVFTDKTIGLAAVANKDGGFSEEDKTVLERIAGNISPILNTRLQRDKQELERKRAEEALRESEVRLKIAMDLAKLVQWEYDVKTGMFSFDEQFYALYGTTSRHEGGPLMSAEAYARKFIPPEESHVVAESIAKSLATTDPNFTDQLEHRIIRADGEERHIIVRYGVVCDQTGRVVKTRGANQDVTERKRAAEALRASEQRLADIIDFLPDATFAINSEGIVIAWNHAIGEMTGVPKESMIGKGNLEYSLPFYGSRRPLLIDLIFAGEEEIRRDYRRVSRMGDTVVAEAFVPGTYGGKGAYLWGISTPLYDKSGKVVAAIESIRDITERRLAEETLKKAEAKYRAIFENAMEGIFQTTPEGRYITSNPAHAKMLGYDSPEELMNCIADIGRQIYADPAQRIEIKRLLTRNGHVKDFRAQLLHKDGTTLWVTIDATSIRDPDGNVLYYQGSMLDISDRKLAEDALRASEERFSRFFRASPVGASITRLIDSQFADINDAFLGLFGYTREEIVGQNLLKLGIWADPEDRSRMVEILQKQGRIQEFETRFRRKSGDIMDVRVSAELTEVAGQQYILGLTHDITERKRGEEERKKLEDQLFQAQKMESVGRLAGGVAHDFNNMLGVIIGRSEMALEQDVYTDKLKDNLKEILKAGLRSADLTRQLLAFARKQTAVPKTLDLNETISGMLNMLSRLIGEDIDLFWVPGLDLWKVKIDPSQVDQILANLVVNARDAISGVGAITMRIENVVIDDSNRAETPEFIPGKYVLLTMSDTGAGMNQEIREKIFEPFFTTKELGKGTGLGLSTVYGIVKQNDGCIYVASEPGKGTTFKIYLPRFEVETAQLPLEDMADNRPTGIETILLVEDDEAILNLSKMILEKQGYTVLAAQTPMHAINLVEEHPGELHLLITDVVMPEMHGRELAEKLSAIRPNLKCLYMSGYTADVIAHRGILDEGVNFIQKPFGSNDFAARVRQVLDHSE